MSTTRREYVEKDLDAVMRYFADGFEAEVVSAEWVIDTHRRKVVFALTLKENTSPPEGP